MRQGRQMWCWCTSPEQSPQAGVYRAVARHARYGESTMTGWRLKRALPYLGEEDFCFTYGDGLADIDTPRSSSFTAEGKRWQRHGGSNFRQRRLGAAAQAYAQEAPAQTR